MDCNVVNLSFKIAASTEKKLKVLEFLKCNFFLDEPILAALKLYEDEVSMKDMENFTLSLINDGLTLMALNKFEEIVGVAVNSVKYKNQSKMVQSFGSKFKKVIKFLEHLENEAKTFERMENVDKAFSLDMLSVHPSFRGKGLAKIMIQKVQELASKMDFKLIRIDCSSQYSTKAALKAGFQTLYKMKYKDYKGDDEEIVFQTDESHQEASSMIQFL